MQFASSWTSLVPFENDLKTARRNFALSSPCHSSRQNRRPVSLCCLYILNVTNINETYTKAERNLPIILCFAIKWTFKRCYPIAIDWSEAIVSILFLKTVIWIQFLQNAIALIFHKRNNSWIQNGASSTRIINR